MFDSPYEELSNDIRLLGRILGDIVREQSGDETFELIESVRQAAVARSPSRRKRRRGTAVGLE